MNEQEKKGTQPVRVHGRYPRKSGINMNMREDRTRELTMLIIGGVLICVLARRGRQIRRNRPVQAAHGGPAGL